MARNKIKIWIKKDISGTYFVLGTYFVGVKPSKPYTKVEKELKKLEDIHPHLPLKQIKAKLRKATKAKNYTPIIKIVK